MAAASAINDVGGSVDGVNANRGRNNLLFLFPVASVIAIALLIVVVGVVIQTWTKCIRLSQRVESTNHFSEVDDVQHTATHQTVCVARVSYCLARRKCGVILTCIFLILKLFYSVIFTLTVVTSAVRFHFRSLGDGALGPIILLERNGSHDLLRSYARDVISAAEASVAQHLADGAEKLETSGRAAKLVCSHYISEQADRVRRNIISTWSTELLDDASLSVSGLMAMFIDSQKDNVLASLKNYVQLVDDAMMTSLRPVNQRHKTFMRRLVDGHWLLYPRSLFNRSFYNKNNNNNNYYY